MTVDAPLPAIGFIGLGVMGASMAGHLLAAGHPLHVYTRTQDKAADLLARGAVWHDGPGDVATAADVVCTMVGFPADVEAVWLGPDGILARARAGAFGIDFTTSSPSLAVRIAAEGSQRGIAVLDAPVSGGDVGAREARLSIMVGGEVVAFERARPLLARLGATIVHQGGPGAGQHCKMANQIAIAANMVGVCEALQYARQAGLDARTVLASISGGAAGSWSLSNLAPRMLDGNFRPGFYVKHFLKDLGIAVEEARRIGLRTPGVDLAIKLYTELVTTFDGADQGTQALYRWYE
jgi:3-hydroxyisobutyrate dehydrogenase